MKRTRFLAIIFLAVFLDMLGVTIIIPVIPALFEGNYALFSGIDVQTRSILYGLLIGSYSIMQFIGAPILGALSDRMGRKPVLLMALFGAFIGYLLFGLAIQLGILWLLYISRMIPGFMGGNIAVIYSAIADISSNEEKAKNFGLVGAAFGLGFTIGPGIGGILADSSTVSWFNYATPFWFTAILTFINMILVKLYFPETLKQRSSKAISAMQGIKNILQVFKLPNLRRIFTVIFLISLGFTFYTQFYAVYLYREFGFSVKDVGILFLWIGIWLVISQGFLVRLLSKKYQPSQVLRLSLFFVGCFILSLLLADQIWQLYIVNALIAIAYGLSSPNLTALVSMEANSEQQGEVLGINQSVNSSAQVIPPLVGGVLLGLHTTSPLLAGGLIMLIGAITFFIIKND